MNPVLLFTTTGPVLGGVGWFMNITWLFWVGAALCVITLFLNLVSKAMKFPVLPILFMAIATPLVSPWYVGLAAGLLAWTALESIGEVVVVVIRKKRRL